MKFVLWIQGLEACRNDRCEIECLQLSDFIKTCEVILSCNKNRTYTTKEYINFIIVSGVGIVCFIRTYTVT
jgi:preprotein translocase subunit Sss1